MTEEAAVPDAGAFAVDRAPTGLGEFYKNMNGPERRTFWACASGWALDGMDFMIYPLVIGTIMSLWSVSSSEAGLAATITLLTSSLGGWLAGYLSDRIGRVITLQITIVWFSVFSLACAFAQDFNQLLVARALLGIGFGGEWAVGSILMGEIVRAQYRGRAVGSVQSGYSIGWGAAALLQALLFSILPPEEAWRYMFAAGALPALMVFFLRRYVEEPPVSVAARRKRSEAANNPSILEIFTKPFLGTTLLASVLIAGAQGGYYATSIWIPRFLNTERHISVVASTGYLATLIIGTFVGFLTGAWLADAIGRRKLFFIFSAGAAALTAIYIIAPLPNQAMWLIGFPLGFFQSGYFSGMGAFLTELYPTRLRGSGQGFCYNFGRGIGATFPALVGYLGTYMSLGSAIAVCSISAYLLFFLMCFAFTETNGKELDA
jgi:MFS family permease